MPECKKCGKKFPLLIKIKGKIRNLCRRSFCLDCSPFSMHNTRNLNVPKVEGHTRNPKDFCAGCGKSPEETSFYESSGSRYCKKCINESKLARDIALKKKAIEYKGGRCNHCGYVGHTASYDFHHLRDKEMSWHMMRNVGWEKAAAELDKCELLCANCHRVVHAKQEN
jgi:hypothetical protein